MAMTLDQLRIFVAVAERRHVTKAAAALGMTQSAASAAISALERRYGAREIHFQMRILITFRPRDWAWSHVLSPWFDPKEKAHVSRYEVVKDL